MVHELLKIGTDGRIHGGIQLQTKQKSVICEKIIFGVILNTLILLLTLLSEKRGPRGGVSLRN